MSDRNTLNHAHLAPISPPARAGAMQPGSEGGGLFAPVVEVEGGGREIAALCRTSSHPHAFSPLNIRGWVRFFCAGIFGIVLAGGVAYAHSWYDPYCCSGSDCAPVSAAAVQVTPAGYVVTLYPHEHLMLKGEAGARVYRVAFRDAKPSADGQFHVCIFPTPDVLRCLYVPPGGV